MISGENIDKINIYVNENINDFHTRRIECIKTLKLNNVLAKKNPYMFRTKHVRTPQELIEPILHAQLSSSEETLFGNFLEGLAIYCCSIFYNGEKAPASGLDLSFSRDGTRYLVAIKSGNNWGNSSQHSKLKADFKRAIGILRQNKSVGDVRAVLGICYGKVEQTEPTEYIKYCGQAFWEFISGDPDLYIDIVAPLGYEAETHNSKFSDEFAATLNRFVKEFSNSFCTDDGYIDWELLVRFNSGRRVKA